MDYNDNRGSTLAFKMLPGLTFQIVFSTEKESRSFSVALNSNLTLNRDPILSPQMHFSFFKVTSLLSPKDICKRYSSFPSSFTSDSLPIISPFNSNYPFPKSLINKQNSSLLSENETLKGIIFSASSISSLYPEPIVTFGLLATMKAFSGKC